MPDTQIALSVLVLHHLFMDLSSLVYKLPDIFSWKKMYNMKYDPLFQLDIMLKVIEVRFGFVYAGVFIVFPVCPLKIILRRYIYINPCCSCRRKCGCDTAITSTFTYTAVEFPNSVAKIFSLTRTMMNIAQLAGPIVGGALLEVGGVKTPFILMGGIQTIMAFIALPFLPDYDVSQYDEGSTKSQSPLSILCIPSIWIPFFLYRPCRMPTSSYTPIAEKDDLLQFSEVVQAVKEGNLRRLNDALVQHDAFFIRYGVCLILEKLKVTTYSRNLFKKNFVDKDVSNPHRSHHEALKFTGIEDIDLDETQ
uniref:Major facilitator superfamily (MFS) profile domain-containing protein n=1 Tax=Daphnia galeata TaxID=27404 RepID=A0A8J2RC75_9CRUS|nr:unnamed protein product [Daphnia galeata]